MQPRLRSTFRVALTVLLAGFVCFASPAEARNKTAKKYTKLYFKADAKKEKSRWDGVLRIAKKMERVAPEATFHLSLLAQANAHLGNRDDAYSALERWVDTGWTNPDGLMDVKKLDPLHGDARFEDLSERAAAMGEAWKEGLRTIHRRLPIEEAEAFDSSEALVQAFEARRMEAFEVSIITPSTVFSKRINGLHDQEVAAAGRYVADHPDADDADDAALAAVLAAERYKEHWEYIDGDAAIVLDTTESFLKGFPDSDLRPQVELLHATATWRAYAEGEAEETLARRAEQAGALLLALEQGFADAPEATKARIWRLNIATTVSDGEITPEVSDLYGKIEPAFEEDEELEQYAWNTASRAMFQIKGPELFDGTDLDGNAWNWDAMEGKVVLIDFWATWCGPCVADVPHIKETYEKYRDAGFEVVGVSLDHLDKDAFLKECDELGIVWPQIYDGKGWESELARSFNIWGIPTPVLLDRDGRVAAVHGDVRGEKLMEQVAELVEAPAGSE